MNTATTIEPPTLAAPGAGLPWPELQAARLLFAWQSWRTPRAAAAALITREKEKILALATSCGPEEAKRPVLIDRLRGMEDSSRCWSIFMTLDHLRIINVAAARVIESLGRGVVPARVASTAMVKPSPHVGAETVEEFASSCEAVARAAEGIANLRTRARYAHPWFGPLDAAHWHFNVGFHQRLHRGQMEAILRGLAEGGAE